MSENSVCAAKKTDELELSHPLQSETREGECSGRDVCRPVETPGSRRAVLHHCGDLRSVRSPHYCGCHLHLRGRLLCLDKPRNSVCPLGSSGRYHYWITVA